MKQWMTFALALGMTHVASAESWKFDCGRSMNVTQVLEIETSPEETPSGYDLKGTFTTSGADQTTGMLTGKTYELEGSTDISDAITGKEESVISMSDINNPGIQVWVVNVKKQKAKAAAKFVNLQRQQSRDFTCILKSYKKK